MTRIDFYLLSTADAHQRRATVCKLIEKAYRQGHAIYLRTGSPEETQALDNLLWTFRQGSFVPHEVCGEPNAPVEAPVIVGHGPAPLAMQDVLINLGPEAPEDYARFARLAEFIDEDEAVKRAGRVRYKAYKDAGYALETHKLEAG
jgi:DNA polymerase-3 subunit chi